MSGDAYGCGYDDYVFDHVLAFECRHEETLPGNLCQEEKWEDGRDHVDHEKSYGDALVAADEEKYTDEHFEKGEDYDEFMKGEEGQSFLLEAHDEGIGWAHAK